jgi:hypothetical protein
MKHVLQFAWHVTRTRTRSSEISEQIKTRANETKGRNVAQLMKPVKVKDVPLNVKPAQQHAALTVRNYRDKVNQKTADICHNFISISKSK